VGAELIIPANNKELKSDLLHVAHEGCGHGGQKQTAERLRRARVSWVGMQADVRKHVASCPPCQRAKAPPSTVASGTLTPRLSTGPFERVVVDYLGPIPASASGNKYILSIVDPFTRWVELRATAEATGETTVAVLERALLWRHGAPSEIQTDGGSHFVNKDVTALCNKTGIEHHVTLPYHPQSNGVAERKNQDIMAGIRVRTGVNFSTWDECVPEVQWHVNTALNRDIGMSPFQALFGHAPRTLLESKVGSVSAVDTVAALRELIVGAQARALAQQTDAALGTKASYDAEHKPQVYHVGDSVLVMHRDGQREHKLATVWRGPSKVRARLDENSYEVTDVLLGNSRRVHVTRMRPFDMTRTTEEAEAVAAAPEGTYIVKEILGHEWRGNELAVLVWWKGYPKAEATWQEASTLGAILVYQLYCELHTLPVAGVRKGAGKSGARRRRP
jgi:transposase InsO family protein